MPVPWLIPAITLAAKGVQTWIDHRREKKAVERQNEYNSPKNQMARFQEAGLNTNLMYGQGNPGNQSAPQNVPKMSPQAIDESVGMYNQTRLTDAQVSATNAKTQQSVAQEALIKLRTQIEATNPVLTESGLKALTDGFLASAAIKVSDAGMKQHQFSQSFTRNQYFNEHGYQIVQAEWDSIVKKYGLLGKDDTIKANIMRQQDFQNDMNEIQKRFMQSGEINSQHIMDFVKMFLSSFLKSGK